MAIIYQKAAQTGRARELVLSILAVLLGVGGFMLTCAGLEKSVPWQMVGLVFAISVAVVVCLHLAIRYLAPYADPVFLPIVVALNGIGLAMIYRLKLSSPRAIFTVQSQIVATLVGMLVCLVFLWFVRDHRLLSRFTYISMLIAIILIISPMIPGLGRQINGARIWIHLPGIGSLQPAELAKLFLAIFFAGYLTAQRDNLSLAGPKILGIQFPRARHFGPIVLVWLMAVAVLVLETDLGTSLLLFGLFVSMLYVATNRISWVVIGLVLLGIAAVVVALLVPHVTVRFAVWLDPFSNEIYNRRYGGSGQIVTGLFGMASGGLFGTGWGQGMPQITPVSYADYIYTALAEELGLTGVFAILCLYMIFVLRGLRTAYRVRDGFGCLLAAGISFTVALQVFVVVGGVTRLIPVTGLTLPFIAHGGSSLMCNWLLLAFLLRISDATRRPSLNPIDGNYGDKIASAHKESTKNSDKTKQTAHKAAEVMAS